MGDSYSPSEQEKPQSLFARTFSPSVLSPGQTDSQVNASLRNQNLRTDLRRVAKRIRKSARKSQKAVNFTHIIG